LATAAILDAINGAAAPLTFAPGDYDPLLDRIGQRSIVLIGDASHGTHDFYRERALITRRLIAERQFRAVAIEGDWTDAYRVNRFVGGSGTESNSREALADFIHFWEGGFQPLLTGSQNNQPSVR
jgi:erythromycin esterase-like protein